MKKLIIVLSLFMLIFMFSASAALAGTVTVSGTFVVGDPTMPVVSISTPNCAAQGVTPVRFHAYEFTVDADGPYTLSLSHTGPVGSLVSVYLMDAGFNPAAAFPNCLAGDNSPPISVTFNLTADTTYYAVAFDDTFSQAGGSYDLTISGPGNILLAGLEPPPAACPYPLPAGSVVRSVPAGAPTFFAPDLGSQIPDLTLPAGTWYVSEIEGDFALVWIACQAQPIYIPVNAIAP